VTAFLKPLEGATATSTFWSAPTMLGDILTALLVLSWLCLLSDRVVAFQVEDSNSAFNFVGDWFVDGNPKNSGGTARCTVRMGSTAVFPFLGEPVIQDIPEISFSRASIAPDVLSFCSLHGSIRYRRHPLWHDPQLWRQLHVQRERRPFPSV